MAVPASEAGQFENVIRITVPKQQPYPAISGNLTHKQCQYDEYRIAVNFCEAQIFAFFVIGYPLVKI